MRAIAAVMVQHHVAGLHKTPQRGCWRCSQEETDEQREARWAAARALQPPPETRDEQVARMEREGSLDPECPMCQREYYARPNTMPSDVFAPRHKASVRCESGKRAHCTCDTCF